MVKSCRNCIHLRIERYDDGEFGTCTKPPLDLMLAQEAGDYAYIRHKLIKRDYGKQFDCENFEPLKQYGG